MTEKKPDRPSERRRWLAVLLATLIMLLSYMMFVYSLAAVSGDEAVFGGGLLGIALGLVPGVFIVAAFVSQQHETIRTALKATGLWLIVAIPLGLYWVPLGLVAGFGAGGVIAFRRGDDHSWRSRALAVAAVSAYTLAVGLVWPELGLFAGAPLPFLAIAAADVFMERRPGEEGSSES